MGFYILYVYSADQAILSIQGILLCSVIDCTVFVYTLTYTTFFCKLIVYARWCTGKCFSCSRLQPNTVQ